MEGRPEAPQRENPAPWQRMPTSITERETQSEAAASGKIRRPRLELFHLHHRRTRDIRDLR